MYILITNDDGVDAPGLLALKRAMERLAPVVVVAPNRNWSAAGHNKTLNRPLRVETVTLSDGSSAYSSDGAPSDCVALVMLGYIAEKPALVVSGINPAGNVAHDLTYSGTVAAAMEGSIHNVPSIAFSVDADHHATIDFAPAEEFSARIARRVLADGLPPDTFLNVNIPWTPLEQIKGVRITRLGKRIYRDVLVEQLDEQGKTRYWTRGDPPSGVIEAGTDIGTLSEGYVSITPVHLDLTSHAIIDRLKPWELDSLRG